MLNDMEFTEALGGIKKILSGNWYYQICHHKDHFIGGKEDELQDGGGRDVS